ncbi:MAG TPA: hypothetical protein VFC18_18850 [Burkholderiales bacterium]|nr:hypothetical protein [Burkholderiales bacterium]
MKALASPAGRLSARGRCGERKLKVVALAPDTDAELERPGGALLSGRPVGALQLVGGGKGEARGVAAPAQLGGEKGFHAAQSAARQPAALDLSQIRTAPHA